MTKKTFKDNPALRFISSADDETNESADEVRSSDRGGDAESEKGAEANNTENNNALIRPIKTEAKSRRVQLLMKPSLYKQIQGAAERREMSINDLIHQVLQQFVDNER